MQVLILILLIAALGGLGYLIWWNRRRDAHKAVEVERLSQRVETLAETVEKLKKLPVKGIEAGAWVDQLSGVQEALAEPGRQLKGIAKMLENQDETYRANFQVLADLSQEQFRKINSLIEQQSSEYRKSLSEDVRELREASTRLPLSLREGVEAMQRSIDEALENMRNRIDEKFASEGEARAVMHMQTADAVRELRGQAEGWQGDLRSTVQEEVAQLAAALEAMGGGQQALIADLVKNQGEARESLRQLASAIAEAEARQQPLQAELIQEQSAVRESLRQLTSAVDGAEARQQALKAELIREQSAAREGLVEQWEQARQKTDEVFEKIENNLQELIAEIAARHTAQMSLLADEFDLEAERHHDLVARRPQARSRQEEEAIFGKLVKAHQKTADRFSRHYYLHLIFMLPHMRGEAFDYFLGRVEKHLPVEVEKCTFEQLRSRFTQIEDTLIEYAVSDADGLAEKVAGRWKGIVESVQPLWVRKVEEAVAARFEDPRQHLDSLRQIPRDWLDAGTRDNLLNKMKALAAQASVRPDARAPESVEPPETSPGKDRKTVRLDEPVTS